MNDSSTPAVLPAAEDARRASVSAPLELYRRHALPVRIMHWINVAALTLMFMSGLQIFNAHPALYWGESSYGGRDPWLVIGAREDPQGNPVGYTRIGGREFTTT